MDQKFTLIADGLQFPEGPVAMVDGTFLVTEIRSGRLLRISPRGDKEEIACLGGGPNGAAIGPDGALYVCNNGNRFGWTEHDGIVHPLLEVPAEYFGGSIQRVDLASGEVKELYTEYRGRRLVSPNDLVFDQAGGFWFTDYGGVEGENLALGSIYYGRVDGSPLIRARRGLFTPNGIGLSPEGNTLYFAETFTGRLWAVGVVGEGRLERCAVGPGKVLATVGNFQALDSLAVEAGGNVCVGSLNPGAITVVTPEGGVEQIPCPDPVTTNLCFAGEDRRDVIITASSTGRLYSTRWARGGLELNFNA